MFLDTHSLWGGFHFLKKLPDYCFGQPLANQATKQRRQRNRHLFLNFIDRPLEHPFPLGHGQQHLHRGWVLLGVFKELFDRGFDALLVRDI